MDPLETIEFITLFGSAQYAMHQNSIDKGFWEEPTITLRQDGYQSELTVKPWNFGEKIALIHSELSEALEKHRKTLGQDIPAEPDEHCPEFDGITIELADAIIRIMDLAGKMKLPLAAAIVAKHNFNTTRPHKHGKGY